MAADANESPQNVQKSFILSVQHKLSFFSARTTLNIEQLLEEYDKSISDELLPNLIKNFAYNQTYQNIFLLPIKEDGLNILEP